LQIYFCHFLQSFALPIRHSPYSSSDGTLIGTQPAGRQLKRRKSESCSTKMFRVPWMIS
jgi:hypothetical protein